MANFEIAHKITGLSEGGYQVDPDDNGNWTGMQKNVGVLIGTNKGISAGVLKEYLKRIPTVAEMKNLTTEASLKIYRKNYWDAIWGDKINSQEIANQMYDQAVNGGLTTGIKLAEELVFTPQDGIMDQSTLDKINNV